MTDPYLLFPPKFLSPKLFAKQYVNLSNWLKTVRNKARRGVRLRKESENFQWDVIPGASVPYIGFLFQMTIVVETEK